MLSKRTKYGLKALSHIARNKGNGPIQIGTIAKSENISHKFLESILLSLRKAQILGSKKGIGGGYYLIKEADQIPLTDVIRILEGPIAMLPCVSLNFYEACDDCPDEAKCSVHRVLIKVRDNTLKVFENTSVADLA